MEYDEILKKLNAVQEENENLKAEFAAAMELQLRMETELTAARDIQIRMVPRTFPAFPDIKNIDIYARLIPAREVGGDFYDYYLLDEDHLAIVMGDVSGKGVAAALMMAICKALLKSTGKSTLSTAAIINHVNEIMAEDNHNYMFVTVFMAVLHLKNQTLTYTNAGHNPTYIKRKDGTVLKLKNLHGPVVAAMQGIQYGETIVDIQDGDLIFAYTDGITEAHNPKGELFTEKHLESILLENNFDNPRQLVEHIFTEALLFERGAEQFDDISALCLEYKAKA